jgi:hypothetical protein
MRFVQNMHNNYQMIKGSSISVSDGQILLYLYRYLGLQKQISKGYAPYLIPYFRILDNLVKESHPFMEPDLISQCPQKSSTGPYPELVESSLHVHTKFSKINFI